MADSRMVHSAVGTRKEIQYYGKLYAAIDIPCDTHSMQPGQFLMVRAEIHDVNWSYPFLIQQVDPTSCRVLASASTQLYQAKPGCPLVVWGPCGKLPTPNITGKLTLLTEPACYLLTTPFLQHTASATLLWLAKEEHQPLMNEKVPALRVNNAKAAIASAHQHKGVLLVALNPPLLQQVLLELSQHPKDDCFLFAPTKMGCGIGACRSCVMHSKDMRPGVQVCCDGPYMPFSAFDFEVDQKCFISIE